MRYTTVIDVTEIPDIWRNPNCTRLYFYMAMRCGYHDNDRDRLCISIRNLAYAAGLSLSACRHALKVLQKFGLVSPMGEYYLVKKFLLETKPTSRTQRTTGAGGIITEFEKSEHELRLKAIKKAVKSCSRQEAEAWLNELQKGQSNVHYGAQIPATESWIKWLQKLIPKNES